MGCCLSIKQFENTENNDRQLKQEFLKKRRRSEARSRRTQHGETPEDRQNPVHQTYNFYYNGGPAEAYTVPEDGQDPRAPNLPMTSPMITFNRLQLESERENEKESERENERESERETERETEREPEIPELPPSPEPRTVYLRIKK